MKQIITSLLDTDLYKLTMQQFVLDKYPKVYVRYEFFNRGGTKFPEGFSDELIKQLNLIGNLKVDPNKVNELADLYPFLKKSYLEWLKEYVLNPEHVQIRQNGGDLKVKIVGPWVETIWWEVPLMALISEMYFEITGAKLSSDWKEVADAKARLLSEGGLNWADFGSRRRRSIEVQQYVIASHKKHKGFVGTSNVEMSLNSGVSAKGTMAHELFMVTAGLFGFRNANKIVLNTWDNEFEGDLGIALTDTFTTDNFLKSFDKVLASKYAGVRHDSGDPFRFTDKVIAHYESLEIDPMSKVIIFSDGLDAEKALEIARYCKQKINCSFGIGTNLTNDTGAKALNIVIKVTGCKKFGFLPFYIPTVKLSDVSGKITGNKFVARIARLLVG